MPATGSPYIYCFHFAPAVWLHVTDILYRYIERAIYILGRCLQHRGGEPEQAKGADGTQLFALDCIAYIVDAETD